MNGLQKIIKYCALAFATILSVTIIGSILMAIFGLSAHLSNQTASTEERKTITKSYTTEEIAEQEITSVLIDCSAKINVLSGTELKIEAQNVTDEYEISVSNHTLRLKDTKTGFFFFRFGFFPFTELDEPVVTVTVPESFIAKEFSIDSGSGKVTVEDIDVDSLLVDGGSGRISISSLVSEYLSIESGSGSVEVNNCTAERSKLNGGSGSIDVTDCSLGRLVLDTGSGDAGLKRIAANDMKVESGSGSISFSGTVTGDSTVDTGSGSVSFQLTGSASDYKITLDSGSGNLWLNGDRKGDGTYGKNKAGSIELETGSGDVTIDFEED